MAEREKIRLPRGAAEIPRDCLVYPRPIRMWGRTEEFLKMLDTKVRKSPVEGVSLKDAALMLKSLGGGSSEASLVMLLSRTMPIHSMTVYRGRVRLSTRELMERSEHEWRAKRTA